MSGKRRDKNQAQIVQALKDAGATVAILSDCGRGIPDLLIGYGGRTFLAEIKNPSGRGLRFTPAEQTWLETWRGGRVFIITSPEEALDMLQAGGDEICLQL
jgi:hypothetical protein